jgi:hypothetical protein
MLQPIPCMFTFYNTHFDRTHLLIIYTWALFFPFQPYPQRCAAAFCVEAITFSSVLSKRINIPRLRFG